MCRDHVHMLIKIPPQYAVSEVIGCLKGESAIFVVFIVFWALLVRILKLPSYILPAPTALIGELTGNWRLIGWDTLVTDCHRRFENESCVRYYCGPGRVRNVPVLCHHFA